MMILQSLLMIITSMEIHPFLAHYQDKMEGYGGHELRLNLGDGAKYSHGGVVYGDLDSTWNLSR